MGEGKGLQKKSKEKQLSKNNFQCVFGLRKRNATQIKQLIRPSRYQR